MFFDEHCRTYRGDIGWASARWSAAFRCGPLARAAESQGIPCEISAIVGLAPRRGGV
jgi:hypothetical protein